jgi:hypothetical protein
MPTRSKMIVRPPPAPHIRIGGGDLHRVVCDWDVAQWLRQCGRIAVSGEQSCFDTDG